MESILNMPEKNNIAFAEGAQWLEDRGFNLRAVLDICALPEDLAAVWDRTGIPRAPSARLVLLGMGGAGFGFGLGFSMLTDPTRSREGLTEGTFGWLGIWGTSFWIDPAEELISILMMQITSYRHFNIRQDFARLATSAITESFELGLQDIRSYRSIERYATNSIIQY